jgi:hypothetical protein
MSPKRPCPMPGVGVVMVSSTACATIATWMRVAGIREPSHRDRRAPMRADSTHAVGRLHSCWEQPGLLLRAASTTGIGEREHAGSVFRPLVDGSADHCAAGVEMKHFRRRTQRCSVSRARAVVVPSNVGPTSRKATN